jgi:hypothetical protein
MIDKRDFIPKYIDNLEKILWAELPEGEYTLQDITDKSNELISKKVREV